MKHTVLAALSLLVLYTALPAAQQDARADSPLGSSQPEGSTDARSTAEPIFGMDKRVPWRTSRITGSPNPPSPYDVEVVFPQLKFHQPVDITNAPGTDRLFVAELTGKMFSFKPAGDEVRRDLFFDVADQIEGAQQVYGLTFHPDFQKNQYCYVCYVLKSGLADGTRVSRFRVTDTDPPTIDPASQQIVITWLSGGHNGGCLKFGPDGFLYISTGDGTGPNPPDTLRTGQDISDLLSSILRIDVNHSENGRPYRVPQDNPFVGMEPARPEVWAYGFRNPWKMSFDRRTGALWVGDVGWELWELIYRVERGGNYGWSVVEGRQPANPEWQRGPTPILPPTVDHPHSEAASITGGYTYYGTRLRGLAGAYIYGDYETGKIWGLRHDGHKVVWHQELVDTALRVICFAEDNDGELYIMDYGGMLYRLVPNASTSARNTFPRRLSETGLFSSVKDHLPAAGVIPYSINAEPWADHAVAERLIGLPGTSQISSDGAKWNFPNDTVLVKTLSMEMRRGSPASRRRLETQILHFSNNQWQGYTYRWNDAQTDAELLDAAGADRGLQVADPQAAGRRQRQTWHYPSRAECLRCHNPWAGPLLAFNSPQLDKGHDYGRGPAPQLGTLQHIGLFEQPLPAQKPPPLCDWRDPSAELNQRARAYLHVNCAHCHRLHAGSAVLSKMRYDLDLEKTSMVGVRPSQGSFGIHAAHVISPGDPCRSVLLYRLAKLGRGRMPHIGSNVVDQQGVELIYEWIEQLSSASLQDAGRATATKLRSQQADLLRRLCSVEDPSAEAATPLVERLLSSTSGALMLLRAVDQQALHGQVQTRVVAKGTAHQDVRVRELFERFLPEEKRLKRLGSVIRPEQILALAGNAERGSRLFSQAGGVECKNCHRIDNVGRELGPDLSRIGGKYNRSQLLEHVLEPSKIVDPKYLAYLVETVDGRLYSGLLAEKGAEQIVLKDARRELISIPADQVQQLVPQRQSLMPDLQLRDMTAQQVADLLEYLSSLK